MKVLVCGGRDYANWKKGFAILDMVSLTDEIEIVNGGASGADAMSSEWAKLRGRPFKEYPADWQTHGRRAGPIRNQQMLSAESPDAVIAFPGGLGTADMVRRAKAAGMRVVEVEAD